MLHILTILLTESPSMYLAPIATFIILLGIMQSDGYTRERSFLAALIIAASVMGVMLSYGYIVLNLVDPRYMGIPFFAFIGVIIGTFSWAYHFH